MTVKEMEAYFADREFFPDPDQQVQLELDNGVRIELSGTMVPEKGVATVRLRKAPPKKTFLFSLTFEANPEIEADTFEDAEQRAYAMLDAAFVSDDSFVAQEPRLLEERP